jgi:hypothetical protein
LLERVSGDHQPSDEGHLVEATQIAERIVLVVADIDAGFRYYKITERGWADV